MTAHGNGKPMTGAMLAEELLAQARLTLGRAVQVDLGLKAPGLSA
jgi:hypothetical protein